MATAKYGKGTVFAVADPGSQDAQLGTTFPRNMTTLQEPRSWSTGW